MFCNNCGKQNIKNAKYCKYCGDRLIKKDYSYDESNHKLQNIIKEDKIFEKKVKIYSLEHIVTRLVISSIDFFFAGIFFIFSLIIINNILNNILSQESPIGSLLWWFFSFFVWFIYIFFVSLLNDNQTIGESLLNMRIETKMKFLSSLLGPTLVSDYFLKTTFFIKPMKWRYLSYILCFILLTWWEYFIFLFFLFLPFISKA